MSGKKSMIAIALLLAISIEYSVAAKPSVRKNGNHLSG